jgi:anti-sigma B factor antagonist
MNDAKVAMDVREAGSGVRIIDVRGEVTASAENALTEAFSQASDDGVRAVILNFEGLEYMNSSGIGLVVMMLIRANRAGQRLLAFGLSDHYRQIFSLTRLDEAIAILDDEQAARAAV